MVRFLLYRPIAVTVSLLAVLVMGIVAMNYIPISLMPDIEAPEITVQLSYPDASARQMEESVVSSLRRSLLPVQGLSNMTSETRDGNSLIKLRFDYGIDMDLAFIEVNEKIDQSMSSFPNEMGRPRVIKASATDIPVFYLEVTLKTDASIAAPGIIETEQTDESLFPVSQQFVNLSTFASQVIRKRLEQLPEVALVDMSGRAHPELLVIPDMQKLESVQLSPEDLARLIQANDVSLGEVVVRDGQYQFNIRFDNALANQEDIGNLYLKVNDRLLQLKELATIVKHPQSLNGLVLHDGKSALTMAIIKQSDARMNDLKEEIYSLTDSFREDYPNLKFAITRDQTQLLDYSISNLTQGLIWGAMLAVISMAVFLRDIKSSLLIGLVMPVSLVVSLIIFFLMDISINIISLSGLVLGLGMMVDNTIIVIDNITQYRQRRTILDEACIRGAEEVSVPMLSSVLTTCAVFIPLIFISGIAGALFYDEAMAVAIGAFVSLAVSITLIPVYYRLIHLRSEARDRKNWLASRGAFRFEEIYERGFRFTMRHQKLTWFLVLSLMGTGFFLYRYLPKAQLLSLTKDEIMVVVDWNERINVMENRRRMLDMLDALGSRMSRYTALVGQQQFLLDERQMTSSETLLYLKANSPEDLVALQSDMKERIHDDFPVANISFEDMENIFKLIFSSGGYPLIANLSAKEDFGLRRNELLNATVRQIKATVPEAAPVNISWQEHILLRTDPVKMTIYEILPAVLVNTLKSALNEQHVLLIADNEDFIPVIIGENRHTIENILQNTEVRNSHGEVYPIREFIVETRGLDLKTILAGKSGEFFPVHMNVSEDRAPVVMKDIESQLAKADQFDVDFSGSILSNQQLIRELALILLISLALLYFILAAQFESLKLPLIILLEIPIDIGAAFIFLYAFGEGINLMSLIGLVVMGGIIINDSILKIDTVNQLRKQGYSILHAIATGGQRRFKSILITSITTILAVVPLLFLPGLGSELQRPLAIVLIGGMGVGTIVSLYFIPLCYYSFVKK